VMTLMGQDVWVDVEDLPLYGLWRVWHIYISCWHEKSPFHSTGTLLIQPYSYCWLPSNQYHAYYCVISIWIGFQVSFLFFLMYVCLSCPMKPSSALLINNWNSDYYAWKWYML
jgi:hypothetical protein